jgi:UDP-hydrolysing UDP-N-acetyl-D-glucosamine 2-epimerase
MRAIAARADLQLLVVAAGAHLLPPACTIEEVRGEFDVAATVPMPEAGRATRRDDARAVGRGVGGFADVFARLEPDWVVVLGDRIEAFAAASAASIGGFAVVHIHGGDRAEGVADEAMRHAITKLAHLHLAATAQSAERIARLGEPERRIHTVGSPAMDGLTAIEPLDDEAFAALGSPEAVFLMHPIGRGDDAEYGAASAALRALGSSGLRADGAGGGGGPVRILALHPNHDPGRGGIMRAIADAAASGAGDIRVEPHLARERFLALLRRVRVLVGNSSAALIEAAAVGGVGCAAVDIGDRPAGRERGGNVVHSGESERDVAAAIARAAALRGPFAHGYGDGEAGERIAAILAKVDPGAPGFTRKQSSY